MGSLILSSFIAGLLMFLAPCTLPLVPAYLAFISGVDPKLLQADGEKLPRNIRWQVFINGLMYVLGFSVVFVLLGVCIAFFGARVVGTYRDIFMKLGGLLVLVFGLHMIGVLKSVFLQYEKKFVLPARFEKGKPATSLLLGAAFACGWSPCIGPILASVLFLASTTSTVWKGALLLGVFSIGMGIPFLILAWGIGSAYGRVRVLNRYMPIISRLGGVFLIILGVLLLMNKLGLFVGWGFELFGFLGYDKLLKLY